MKPVIFCHLFQNLLGKLLIIENLPSKNKILYKYCLTLLIDKINKGFEPGEYMG